MQWNTCQCRHQRSSTGNATLPKFRGNILGYPVGNLKPLAALTLKPGLHLRTLDSITAVDFNEKEDR